MSWVDDKRQRHNFSTSDLSKYWITAAINVNYEKQL